MNFRISVAVAACPLLFACGSTSGTPESIEARYNAVAEAEFSYEAVGIPVVDGPAATFVAYLTARQQVLDNMKSNLDFPVIERFDSAMQAEVAAMTPEGEELTEALVMQAASNVRATMTPDEVNAMDSQVAGMDTFMTTFTAEVLKAGVTAIGIEVLKDSMGEAQDAIKTMEMMQKLKAGKELANLAGHIETAAEINSIISYLKATEAVWQAAGDDV